MALTRRPVSVALALSAVLALPALLAACGNGASATPTGAVGGATAGGLPAAGQPANGQVIRIATDFPVTGSDAAFGLPDQNAAELAVADANRVALVPGYQFQLVTKDDASGAAAPDPATGAANVAADIADASVAGIVGPGTSDVAETELPLTNSAPIALVSPSANEACLTVDSAKASCTGATSLLKAVRPTGKVTFFRLAAPNTLEAAFAADFLYHTKGERTIWSFDDTSRQGTEFSALFDAEWRNLGGIVKGSASVAPTTSSYVNILTQVAAGQPDAIVYGGDASTGGVAIREQMARVPALLHTSFLGDWAVQSAGFGVTIGTIAGPAYSTLPVPDVSTLPNGQAFLDEYAGSYGAPAGPYAAAAYDATMTIVQGVKAAIAAGAKPAHGSNDAAGARAFRQAVLGAIAKGSFDGVEGSIAFDPNGDLTNPKIGVYVIAHGGAGSIGWQLAQESPGSR